MKSKTKNKLTRAQRLANIVIQFKLIHQLIEMVE